jgi:hypothetical protein
LVSNKYKEAADLNPPLLYYVISWLINDPAPVENLKLFPNYP